MLFGKYSSKISVVLCTHFASPCAISRFVPALVSRKISHGTAKTSRPCSRARVAVMSVPLFIPASAISMPSESAATISFRIGKKYGSGFVPIGNIETRAQLFCKIFSKRGAFWDG